MTEAKINLLVLGWGYSARHGAALLEPRLASLAATARHADKAARMSAEGIETIRLDRPSAQADLDAAIAGASHVLASAGPSEAGDPFLDDHIDAFRASARAGTLKWIGYLSTVGVYGNADGGFVDEDTPAVPASERTRWRVATEAAWRALGREEGVPVAILRLAGI